MEKKFDKMDMGLACLLVSYAVFMFTAIIFEPKYPEPPRFTEKVENANSIKVLAVDGDYYWVVQEKIGQRTYNIILKPVGKVLKEDSEI
jgi:hypothetical protein